MRHGQVALEQCLLGRTDSPLSEMGKQQMAEALVSSPVFDHLYCSPLLRCADFSREYTAKHLIPLTVDKRLAELDFGDWDGQPYQQLWQLDGERLGLFWQDPWQTPPPNGETMANFTRRIDEMWQQLLEQHQGESLLVVTHGGVMRYLLAKILKMPLPGSHHLSAIELPYASRISVSVWHDEDGRSWPKVHWG